MQSTILPLIAMLAPLPAAAFGDLDCVGIESCGLLEQGGVCSPTRDLMSVTFDWMADEATVQTADQTATLDFLNSGETSLPDAPVFSMLEYAALVGDQGMALRIESTNGEITAYLSTEAPTATTLVAQCSDRTET